MIYLLRDERCDGNLGDACVIRLVRDAMVQDEGRPLLISQLGRKRDVGDDYILLDSPGVLESRSENAAPIYQ